jgi:hypothetical protein
MCLSPRTVDVLFLLFLPSSSRSIRSSKYVPHFSQIHVYPITVPITRIPSATNHARNPKNEALGMNASSSAPAHAKTPAAASAQLTATNLLHEFEFMIRPRAVSFGLIRFFCLICSALFNPPYTQPPRYTSYMSNPVLSGSASYMHNSYCIRCAIRRQKDTTSRSESTCVKWFAVGEFPKYCKMHDGSCGMHDACSRIL